MKISGKVIRGKSRGKKIGYPTANIRIESVIPHGIYISTTVFKNKLYKSVTFVGNSKTFGEEEVFAETYILNFKGNLYGNTLRIDLIKKIRENYKFGTVEKLIEQIKKDVEETIEYFNK